MKVAIIILNYNSYEMSCNCLRSCLTYKNEECQIVIVDNNSTDNSFNRIKQEFGNTIQYIQNKDNYGYAKGNNDAIKKLIEDKIEYIFILNPDTEAHGIHLVDHMVEIMEKNPSVAVIQPKVMELVSGNYRVYKNRSGYLKMLETFKVLQQREFKLVGMEEGKWSFVSEAIGCALFIRLKAFCETGGFPEEVFMYCDETIFCKKIIQSGYNIIRLESTEEYINHNHDIEKSVKLWVYYLKGRNQFIEQGYLKHNRIRAKICYGFSLCKSYIRIKDKRKRSVFFEGVKKGKLYKKKNLTIEEYIEDAKQAIYKYKD